MTLELSGKTAIVTGASRGIGKAIAIKLGNSNFYRIRPTIATK